MLTARRLATALSKIPLVPFNGELCRCVSADTLYGFGKAAPYAPRPLYDLGPGRSGARYTPKGGAPTVYAAGDYDTAVREYLQVPVPAPLLPHPRTFVIFTLSVRLRALLDLTDASILGALGTSPTELTEPWRYRRDRKTPPTHVLGSVVARAGDIQALKFRSTKGSGFCLAILTATVVAPEFVRVFDPASKLVQCVGATP